MIKIPYSAFVIKTSYLGLLKTTTNEFTGLSRKIVFWDACRDVFLYRVTDDTKIVLYKQLPTKLTAIRKFIQRLEDVLKLKRKDRIVFCETDKKDIIALQISKWWRVKHRISLLTMFLRIGRKYKCKQDNWKDVIETEKKYTLNKNAAVFRFLRGYTELDDCKCGWLDYFKKNKSILVLRKP